MARELIPLVLVLAAIIITIVVVAGRWGESRATVSRSREQNIRSERDALADLVDHIESQALQHAQIDSSFAVIVLDEIQKTRRQIRTLENRKR